MSPLKSTIVFTLLLINFHWVFSFQCYDCAGPLNKGAGCEDDLGNEATVECTDDRVCVKFVLEKPETLVLTRKCDVKEICTKLREQYDPVPTVTVESCDICTENLCNSTRTTKSSLLFLIFATLVVATFYSK